MISQIYVATHVVKDNLRTADSVAGKQDLQMTYSYAADKQITADCNA